MLPTDAEWRDQYRQFNDSFPGDQIVVVFVDKVICDDRGWELFQRLHDSLAQSGISDNVQSIAGQSSRIVLSSESSISFDSFRDVDFGSAYERCATASRYLPFKSLVTDQGNGAAIYVFVRPGIDAVNATNRINDVVSGFAEEVQRFGGELFVTGEPVLSSEVAGLIASDSQLMAISFVLMLGLVYMLSRSTKVLFAVLCLNVFVLVVAFGVMGWFGITLTPATSLVIFLLIPISTAFVIHVVGYSSRSPEDPERGSLLGFSIAGLSTAIGFAATGFTSASDIQLMAVMGVVGVAAAVLGVYAIAFPILRRTLPHYPFLQWAFPTRFLAHPIYGRILLVSLLLLAIVGVLHLQIDYSPISNLPESNIARDAYNETRKHFGGLSVPLVVEAGDVETVKAWAAVSGLVDHLEAQFGDELEIDWLYPQLLELANGFSIAPNLSDEAIAQFLLLFSAEDIVHFLSDDKTKILLNLQIQFDGSARYLEVKSAVESYLNLNGMAGSFVGRVSAFFESGHRVGKDTIRGLVVSCALLLVVLWILFKSFPLALAGIVVNVIPVAVGLGTLGLLKIPIEMGSSIVAAVAFGILLDDSMHLLVRVRELVRSGYDPSTAVSHAVRELFGPIAATTLTIVIGYSILFFATLQSFNDFAAVIVVTLIVALASDLVVLPILIRRLFRDPVKVK